MHEAEKIKIKDKGLQQLQNIEDLIEIIQENVTIKEQQREINADIKDRKINYEINKNLLKYRKQKTPDDETSNGEDTDKIFSLPTYKAKPKPLKIKDEKEH